MTSTEKTPEPGLRQTKLHNDGAESPFCDRLSADLTVQVLAVLFLIMAVLGVFLGDVFETYHNGSSL